MRGELDRAQDVLRSAVDSAVAASDRRLELRAKLESIFVESLVDPEKTPELVPLASAAIPVFESYRDHRALGRAWMLLGHVRGAFACELEACAEASARAARHYREAGWSAATCLGNLAAALHDGPLPLLSRSRSVRSSLLSMPTTARARPMSFFGSEGSKECVGV